MRILTVENTKGIHDLHVWLNGKEVTNLICQARVPNRPKVTGLGWVDRFETDAEGHIVFVEKVGGPRVYRSYGLVRWTQRTA